MATLRSQRYGPICWRPPPPTARALLRLPHETGNYLSSNDDYVDDIINVQDRKQMTFCNTPAVKVSVSDHTSGKHVNDRPDLLLSHTGIAHAFFIYLTLIYSSNMLHNDKEKYWELVEVLPAFRIRLNKL